MATFPAFYIKSPSGGIINDYLTNAYHQYQAELWPPNASDVNRYKMGPMIKMTPVEANPRTNQGFSVRSYKDDFYNRIHIVPKEIDLGNILSVQRRYVEVWNAHFDERYLSGIVETNTEGVDNTFEEVLNYMPLMSRTYEVTVSTKGPPIVDASFEFNFPESNPILRILGRRVVIWPFMPQANHQEVLEWKTDVLGTLDQEQRIALRDAPRQGLSYTFHLDEQQFSRAKAMATQWSHRVYSIPVWAELEHVGALSKGTTTIYVDTRFADYRVGGTVLIWGSDAHAEAGEVSELYDDRVVLARPIEDDYPEAIVSPLRFARTMDGVNFSRSDHAAVVSKASFLITDNEDLSSTAGYPTYRGKEVVTDELVILQDMAEKISRSMDVFDNGQGQIVVDTKNDWVDSTKQLTFDALDREQRWRFRGWIHSRKGKQKSFWMPSWNSDLVLATDAKNGDAYLTVQPIGYPLYYGEKDIMIQTTSGTLHFMRILSSETDGDGYERLFLEELLPQDFNMADVYRICFLSHLRFDSDRVQISHGYAGRASTSIAVKETPE